MKTVYPLQTKFAGGITTINASYVHPRLDLILELRWTFLISKILYLSFPVLQLVPVVRQCSVVVWSLFVCVCVCVCVCVVRFVDVVLYDRSRFVILSLHCFA